MAAASPSSSAPDAGFAAVFRRLTALAWPIVAARLGVQVMGLVDAVVVGRFSARELGFHALGWAPTTVVLTGGVGLLMGVQVVAARRVGEGRPELAGAVLRRGLAYAAAIGAVCTALLVLGGDRLMLALRLAPDLAHGSGRAMQVFALSLTPYLAGVAFSLWLEGLGRPAPGLRAIWAANLLNLLLNLLLVPGTWGLPALGAVGAGWAALGARTLYGAWLAVHVWRMPDARALGVFARPPREPEAARDQRRVGYGAGASYLVEAGAFAGMNVVAGWLGATEVAAWAILLNVSAVVFMIPLGVAGATAVLVGAAYGADDRPGVTRATEAGCAAALGAALIVAVATWVGATAVAGAYATDPRLAALAAASLALAVPFFAPDALQAVLAQALRARADVLTPTIIHVACYGLGMLPLGWWLAHPGGQGLAGCVEAVIAASFAAAGALGLRFAWLTWRDRS